MIQRQTKEAHELPSENLFIDNFWITLWNYSISSAISICQLGT